MKNYKINTSFARPEESKSQANKNGNNVMLFILIFREKLSLIQC